MGSKAAPWVHNLCSNKTSSPVLRWLAEQLNYCDPDLPGQVYRGYETLRPDFPGIKDLRLVAQDHVTKAMCGTSAFGLTTVYSAALEALATEVGYGQDNDGMVAVDSCMLPFQTYEQHYTKHFYLAQINHADGTCRAGNGVWGLPNRQPCLWLAGLENTTDLAGLENSTEQLEFV